MPYEVLDRVRPKPGVLIEARGVMKRQVAAIAAMAALTYFTFGFGTAGGSVLSWATKAFGSKLLGVLVTSTVYAAGAMLINKVLGPKLPSQQAAQSDPVY